MSKSDLIVQLLEQRPGIKSVVRTRRTIILSFDDGYIVNIEAELHETDSGFMTTRLDVDVINKNGQVEVRPQLCYIQMYMKDKWCDYHNNSGAIKSTNFQVLEDLVLKLSKSQGVPLRIIDQNGKVLGTYRFETKVCEQEEMNYKVQCRVASDEPWTDVQNSMFSGRAYAEARAQEYSRSPMIYGMTRVVAIRTDEAVSTYSGGKPC